MTFKHTIATIALLLFSVHLSARTDISIPSAYLKTDGTLFFYAGRRVLPPEEQGTVKKSYTVSESGYSNSNLPDWYEDRADIRRVVFDESFINDVYLESTAFWFYMCENIKSFEGLGNIYTANVTDMTAMFNSCKSLKTLDLSSMNTSQVQKMYAMFYDCNSLQYLDLSGIRTDNVTSFGHMFRGCSNLRVLDLSSFDTSKVTDMYAMFLGCNELMTIYVSDLWNTNSVTSSTHMFGNCYSIQGEKGTSFNANHTDLSYAKVDGGTSNPGYLSYSTYVDYSGYEAYSVLKNNVLTFYFDKSKEYRDGDIFDFSTPADWTNLDIKKAVFDSSFSKYKPFSLQGLFNGCYDLQSVDGLTNLNTERVTDMSRMFYNCCSLVSIDLRGLNLQKATDLSWMFYNCFSLKNINMAGLNTSRVKDMNNMFYWCISLTNLNLSSFKTESVENMESMFEGCHSLSSLSLNSFNTKNVTSMSSMFRNCYNLSLLDISTFNTANVTSMSKMFSGCFSMSEIKLQSFDTQKVTDMSYMFYDSTNDIGIKYTPRPKWLSYYETIIKNINIPTQDKLAVIDLSSFNTSNVENMGCMFWDRQALKTIYAKEDWILQSSSNSRSMFLNCESLVGGMGTKYSSAQVDATYARIDKGMSSPGYFTDVNSVPYSDKKEAYAVLNNGKLTFYYDGQKSTRQGKTYEIEEWYASEYHKHNETVKLPAWSNDSTSIVKAAFDSSFSDYVPKSLACWFYDCSKLITIEGFGYLNTKQVNDMGNMFFNCKCLTSLNLSTFDTQNVKMMDAMFYGCESLTDLNISNFKTSTVIWMQEMFSLCKALTTLNLRSFDTSNVEYMHNMFRQCENIEELDLSNFNTAKVIRMDYMFGDCNMVKKIDVSSFNTSKVESMAGMFMDCYWLNKLEVNNFNTSNVRTMSMMFTYCNSLETLDLSNFRTSKVTNMQWMFHGCSGLKSLNINNFDTSMVEYMNSMFSNCRSLPKLDISHFNTTKVKSMHSMFFYCKSLTSLDVTNFVTTSTQSLGYLFAECSGLTEIDLRSFDTKGVKDMKRMFAKCNNLKTIYASRDLWSTENVEDNGEDMFISCNNVVGGCGTVFDENHVGVDYAVIDECGKSPGYLTDEFGEFDRVAYTEVKGDTVYFYYDKMMSIREGETRSIRDGDIHISLRFYNKVKIACFDPSFKDYHPTTLNGWFFQCTEMEKIENLHYLQTDQVVDMSEMFWWCRNLEELDLSNFYTSHVTDMGMMFDGCKNLKALDVSKFNTSNVTDMYAMFRECWNINVLDVSNFNTSNVEDMSSMFEDCANIVTLDVSKFNTSNVTGMGKMFFGCRNIKALDVSNFDTSNTQEMSNMFFGCSSLTNLDISNFDTYNVKDMDGMFGRCISLSKIFAGNKWSTKTVVDYNNGRALFSDCTNLVGGLGTKYDPNHVDYTYAHIDGGPTNPGYFTYKATTGLVGDVNNDGLVGIGDIVAVTNVMAGSETNILTKQRADVNADGQVGIGDIVAITNIMAGTAAARQQ